MIKHTSYVILKKKLFDSFKWSYEFKYWSFMHNYITHIYHAHSYIKNDDSVILFVHLNFLSLYWILSTLKLVQIYLIYYFFL